MPDKSLSTRRCLLLNSIGNVVVNSFVNLALCGIFIGHLYTFGREIYECFRRYILDEDNKTYCSRPIGRVSSQDDRPNLWSMKRMHFLPHTLEDFLSYLFNIQS